MSTDNNFAIGIRILALAAILEVMLTILFGIEFLIFVVILAALLFGLLVYRDLR